MRFSCAQRRATAALTGTRLLRHVFPRSTPLRSLRPCVAPTSAAGARRRCVRVAAALAERAAPPTLSAEARAELQRTLAVQMAALGNKVETGKLEATAGQRCVSCVHAARGGCRSPGAARPPDGGATRNCHKPHAPARC